MKSAAMLGRRTAAFDAQPLTPTEAQRLLDTAFKAVGDMHMLIKNLALVLQHMDVHALTAWTGDPVSLHRLLCMNVLEAEGHLLAARDGLDVAHGHANKLHTL